MNPLIAIGVTLIVIFFLLPMIGLRRKGLSTGPAPLSKTGEKEVQQTLDDVFLRLQEFSRETLAKLDTRVRMLNQLVLDADERIKKLEAMRAAPPASAPSPPPPPPAPTADPLHDRIYRMMDGGSSLSDISKEVGLPKGEVELIAGLRGLPRQGG